MSNGHVCCLTGVCCYPLQPKGVAQPQVIEEVQNKRKKALAELLVEGDESITKDQAQKAAGFLMTQVGFVPVGVDVTVATLYRPLFESNLAR